MEFVEGCDGPSLKKGFRIFLRGAKNDESGKVGSVDRWNIRPRQSGTGPFCEFELVVVYSVRGGEFNSIGFHGLVPDGEDLAPAGSETGNGSEVSFS